MSASCESCRHWEPLGFEEIRYTADNDPVRSGSWGHCRLIRQSGDDDDYGDNHMNPADEDKKFPTPVLLALLDHFDPADILAAEAAVALANVPEYRDDHRGYWDRQIWRLTDALFRLHHPRDPNPMPRIRLFSYNRSA